jgi:hypothetical protein
MIVTLGGRFSGYGLYLLKGKPVFVYNMLDLKRCVPAQSLRAFMSSIMRWRSGLTASVLIGNSCLE